LRRRKVSSKTGASPRITGRRKVNADALGPRFLPPADSTYLQGCNPRRRRYPAEFGCGSLLRYALEFKEPYPPRGEFSAPGRIKKRKTKGNRFVIFRPLPIILYAAMITPMQREGNYGKTAGEVGAGGRIGVFRRFLLDYFL
jgi:hypothetical protein